ncbi:hypothetical protein ACLHDG_05450 [Sulfurovum sp. CS9]|uniref:hypothetical protein n=1 Tax=Sulfurovum sp. CS9 TaxID=3391146 RepID=UPI0039EB7D10
MDKVQYNKDHAVYVIDNLDNNGNTLIEFITSVDIAILIAAGYTTQNSINEVMIMISSELLKFEMTVREKNGINRKRNGEIIQKYTNRPIGLDKLLIAYHNQHIDASIPVNPHFHILADEKARLGKNFQYLRQALEQYALLFNIQFHFMMERRETGLSKKQQKVIEKMAMTLQRGTEDEKSTYLSDDKVYQALGSLDIHYAHSNNISYFLKQISILNKCLRDMNMDFEYQGINLKDEIYFYLTSSQYKKLMLLKTQQNVKLDLSDVLDREILKCAFDFESIVMNILKEKFEIGEISQENLTYSMPSFAARKKQKALNNSDFYKYIQQDIRNVLSVATSFYRFKEMMRKMDYVDVKVKKKKVNKHTRKEVAFKLQTKKHSDIEISFGDIGLSWSRILQIFENNRRRRKKEKMIESRLRNYKKKTKEQEESLLRFVYEVNEVFTIKYGKESKFNSEWKPILVGFEVQYSAEFNITTYISDDIVIVDYPGSLEIKKCNDVSMGIDVISQFLPDNTSIDKLDITYQGSKEYVDNFEKRMKESQVAVKTQRKAQAQRPKFKM